MLCRDVEPPASCHPNRAFKQFHPYAIYVITQPRPIYTVGWRDLTSPTYRFTLLHIWPHGNIERRYVRVYVRIRRVDYTYYSYSYMRNTIHTSRLLCRRLRLRLGHRFDVCVTSCLCVVTSQPLWLYASRVTMTSFVCCFFYFSALLLTLNCINCSETPCLGRYPPPVWRAHIDAHWLDQTSIAAEQLRAKLMALSLQCIYSTMCECDMEMMAPQVPIDAMRFSRRWEIIVRTQLTIFQLSGSRTVRITSVVRVLSSLLSFFSFNNCGVNWLACWLRRLLRI